MEFFVRQPKKYIDKLADTYKRLFNEDPPKGYKTPLDKNDRPELDVGSPQVSFLMCTFRNTTKIAVQVLLLLTLFTFTFEPFLKL